MGESTAQTARQNRYRRGFEDGQRVAFKRTYLEAYLAGFQRARGVAYREGYAYGFEQACRAVARRARCRGRPDSTL